MIGPGLLYAYFALYATEKLLPKAISRHASNAKMKKYALLFAPTRFKNPKLRSLKFAYEDAIGLAEVLRSVCRFDEVHILAHNPEGGSGVGGLVNGEPISSTLQDKLAEFQRKCEPHSLFLFGAFTHGIEIGGKICLLAEDTGSELANPLQLDVLNASIARIPSVHRVVMIDACREDFLSDSSRGSSKAISKTFARNLAGSALSTGPSDKVPGALPISAVLSACSSGQLANEDLTLRHGVLTHFVIQAIKYREHTRITMSAVARDARRRVKQWCEQYSKEKRQEPWFKQTTWTPWYKLPRRGEIVLAGEDFAPRLPIWWFLLLVGAITVGVGAYAGRHAALRFAQEQVASLPQPCPVERGGEARRRIAAWRWMFTAKEWASLDHSIQAKLEPTNVIAPTYLTNALPPAKNPDSSLADLIPPKTNPIVPVAKSVAERVSEALTDIGSLPATSSEADLNATKAKYASLIAEADERQKAQIEHEFEIMNGKVTLHGVEGALADLEKASPMSLAALTPVETTLAAKWPTALAGRVAAANERSDLIRSAIKLRIGRARLASQKGASASRPWTNSIGMRFVLALDGKLLVSMWETRVQDYRLFVSETGHKTPPMTAMGGDGPRSYNGATWENPGFSVASNHPVVGVTWQDAKAFCQWLTDRERSEGGLSASELYRLPTDAEWDALAGAGDFGWGASWPPPPGAANLAGSEAAMAPWPPTSSTIPGYSDGFPRTSPVGSFSPNRLGLYDLDGNVREWCEDLAQIATATADFRTIRGSGWDTAIQSEAKSGWHDQRPGYLSDDATGFRVVLTGVQKESQSDRGGTQRRPSPSQLQPSANWISPGAIAVVKKSMQKGTLTKADGSHLELGVEYEPGEKVTIRTVTLQRVEIDGGGAIRGWLKVEDVNDFLEPYVTK